MLIGYMRVSAVDGPQATISQRHALIAAGVAEKHLYEDCALGKTDARPGLDAALKALRIGDTLVVWKLDRLGRDLRHLVSVVHDLARRGIGLKVLSGPWASLDTTASADAWLGNVFAALTEFEHQLHSERTKAGQASARAFGRRGGAPYKMTVEKLHFAMAAMGQADTNVGEICNEIGITRQTLFRHLAPDGSLRHDGEKLLARQRCPAARP